MDIKRITVYALAAATLLGAGACQKKYQMVPPPSVEQGDDIDDEDFWGDKNRTLFVTPYGDGEVDGSSWENALDADTFMALLSDQTDLSTTQICLAEGTYYMSSGAVFGPEIRKNILSVSGGYSLESTGKDLTKRDINSYETIFSGDLNKNGRADEGDCGLLSVFGGQSSFNGITFRHGYINETTASALKSGAGVFVKGNDDTWVEFVDCRFEGCTSAATTSSYAGGPAAYILSGQARFKGCEFSGCSSASRGGALRCNDEAAILFLDRCSIHDNYVDSDWGSGVQMSSGTICMNNTTICSNTVKNSGNGGALNGGGAMLILNSTIISDDNTAGIRCESGPERASFIANSIGINVNGKPGFLLNGSGRVAVSGGWNIFNSTSGDITRAATDITCETDLKTLGSLQDGVYVWDNSKVSQSLWAKASDIETYARTFNPQKCPGIGAVFAEWCGANSFGVDQRGNARNADKLLPGAYDPGLSGTSPNMMRFGANALAFSGSSSRVIQEFGFVMKNPEGTGSYAKKMVLTGGEYLPEDGVPMLWDGSGATEEVTAFAPWAEIADNQVKVSCPQNQKSQSDLDAADFVLYKGMVNPSTDLVDGKIQLNFSHLNTRLLVKVNIFGTPASTSALSSVSVSGLKNSGVCNIEASEPSVEADGASVKMYPFVGTDSYELITVPQTIPAESLCVNLTYKGDLYEWASTSEITLLAGKTSSLTVNLVTTKSASKGEIIVNGQIE